MLLNQTQIIRGPANAELNRDIARVVLQNREADVVGLLESAADVRCQLMRDATTDAFAERMSGIAPWKLCRSRWQYGHQRPL